jgi:hypothetical protein
MKRQGRLSLPPHSNFDLFFEETRKLACSGTFLYAIPVPPGAGSSNPARFHSVFIQKSIEIVTKKDPCPHVSIFGNNVLSAKICEEGHFVWEKLFLFPGDPYIR